MEGQNDTLGVNQTLACDVNYLSFCLHKYAFNINCLHFDITLNITRAAYG